MSENKLPNKAITEIVKSAEKHFGKTYDNLTDEPTKAIGKGLTEIIEIVFAAFKLWNKIIQAKVAASVENFKKEIEEKSNSIPEDKLTEPSVQIITTAIENSKYCITEDELREMFVNLISSACNTDTKDKVHPAFSAIIKEMSPHDARLLKDIKGLAEFKEFRYSHILDKCGNEYGSPEIKMSVDNLVRLGLLEVKFKFDQGEIRREATYKQFHLAHSSSEFNFISNTDYSFTLMGKSFIEVCC